MIPRLAITLRAAGVRRGRRWALAPTDLDLGPGQRWALVGENGSGKTHLLKLLAGDLWPTPNGRERRTYRLGEEIIDEAQGRSMIAFLGAEAQDKYQRLDWNFRVREVLTAGVQGTDIVLEAPDRKVCARVSALLRMGALSHLANRRFLTLSYGQRRLVLLLRALARQPHWLLLDEPYNGLDARSRKRLDALLDRVRRRGQAWMVSAHHEEDIPAGTKWWLRLSHGRMIDCDRARNLQANRRSGALAPRPAPRTGGTPARTFRQLPAAGESLLEIRGASLYVEDRCVLSHVDWQLRGGEHWAICGENGAGKSSFLRMLYGDLAPAFGGTIIRAGFPPGTPIEEWKKTVGFVSPELQADHAIDVSVSELVISGRYASLGLNDAPTTPDRRRARAWIRCFGLSGMDSRRPRELSYGQLRRALLARAMMAAPKVLLLDEPLTGLDAVQRAGMRVLLAGLMRKGVTVIMSAHHVEDLPDGMTHVLRLHKRRARAQSLKS